MVLVSVPFHLWVSRGRAGKEYQSQATLPASTVKMRKAVLAFITLLAISSSILPASASVVRVGKNVNVVPQADRQLAETTVAIDPRNPNMIVAGAQDYKPAILLPYHGAQVARLL